MKVSAQALDKSRDFPMLKSWWEKRGFPPAEIELTPPTGRVVFVDGVPTCAGFLFKTDAGAAIIGNVVSNPEQPGEARNAALDFLIDFFTFLAKTSGFRVVCCSTNLERLMVRYEAHGFKKTDSGVSHFGKGL